MQAFGCTDMPGVLVHRRRTSVQVVFPSPWVFNRVVVGHERFITHALLCNPPIKRNLPALQELVRIHLSS